MLVAFGLEARSAATVSDIGHLLSLFLLSWALTRAQQSASTVTSWLADSFIAHRSDLAYLSIVRLIVNSFLLSKELMFLDLLFFSSLCAQSS